MNQILLYFIKNMVSLHNISNAFHHGMCPVFLTKFGGFISTIQGWNRNEFTLYRSYLILCFPRTQLSWAVFAVHNCCKFFLHLSTLIPGILIQNHKSPSRGDHNISSGHPFSSWFKFWCLIREAELSHFPPSIYSSFAAPTIGSSNTSW